MKEYVKCFVKFYNVMMILFIYVFYPLPFGISEIKLPSFFSDHMVLQQDIKIPIYGTSFPGEKIIVRILNTVVETKADEMGNWKVYLPPMKAGGPYKLIITGEKDEMILEDIYIGDVWIASGQSNMYWPVSKSMNAEEEIASANYPQIRLLKVGLNVSKEPQWDIKSKKKWEVCSPESVGDFSAVAYFFIRELYKNLNIPMGIINASVGGTKIEAWTSMETLKNLPELQKILEVMAENSQKRPTLLPSGLFNGMIAPLTNFPIKGIIWYQGESNADRPKQYSILFPSMINDWRKHWGIGNIPFLFVQLANFKERLPEPSEDPWADLREAQLSALKLPNTGMAVAIDVGEADNIHPKNKQEVGRRLALIALAIAYNKNVVYSGPMFHKMQIEGNKIRIFFKHVGGGLVCKGENLKGFAIAGEDKKFYWADGKIEENTVIVWSDKVSNPVAVRYAWGANPECNLYNKEGLPAVPFRTDIPDYMKKLVPWEDI